MFCKRQAAVRVATTWAERVGEGGENRAVGVQAGDVEGSWLFGADDPGAEVRLQWTALFVTVLDHCEVLDLGCCPAGGDEGRVSGCHLGGLGLTSVHHRICRPGPACFRGCGPAPRRSCRPIYASAAPTGRLRRASRGPAWPPA